MKLDDLFIEQIDGGNKKVVLEKSLKEVKGNVKHLLKKLLKRQHKGMDNHVAVLLDYNKEKVIVEMNSKKIMINGNYIYLFKVAAGTLKVDDKTCKNIQKTILVNFNKFNTLQDNFIDIGYIKNKDGQIISEIVKVININVAKAFDKSYTYLNEFEENIARICRIFSTTNSSDLKKRLPVL